MRITSLTTHLLTARWSADPWFPNTYHATAIVRITTDSGMDGLGEITWGYFAPEAVPSMVEYFESVLIGRDPDDFKALIRDLMNDAVWWARSGAGRSVISGIELALWDLRGKAAGLPVFRLLGGATQSDISVYASGGPTAWPVEDNIRKVGFYLERGYAAVKLSTGFYALNHGATPQAQGRLTAVKRPFAEQVSTLEACFSRLRREFGAAIDLAVDGHQGAVPNPIPVSEAVAIADALAPHRLRFYEEPLAYTNLDGYCELRSRSKIPVAGGESLCGLDQFHGLIAGKGVHIIQPDIGFVGGIAETVRIVHHAEAFNLKTALHTGASMGPSFAASWHLAAAFESVEWLEQVVAAREIQNDLLVQPFVLKNGRAPLPTEPGLGVKLSADLLEKYPFKPKSGERT